MAHPSTRRAHPLSVTPIAAACAALLWGGAAMAQDSTQDGAPSQVVVTGIRGSIESSIAIKKDADNIVEEMRIAAFCIDTTSKRSDHVMKAMTKERHIELLLHARDLSKRHH